MANTQRDPVCNMDIDSKNAAGQSDYKGETYHFCSKSCKSKFDKNPQQYAKQRGQGAGKSS